MTSGQPDAASSAVVLALRILDVPTGAGRARKTDRDDATDTDYRIEDALREHLRHLTPELGFLGEERGHTGPTDRYWCLDPVDGTTNFTRGLPNYGVALALFEDHQPVGGEIALPAHRERYSVRGGVAVRDGRPYTLGSPNLLAAAPGVHAALLSAVRGA